MKIAQLENAYVHFVSAIFRPSFSCPAFSVMHFQHCPFPSPFLLGFTSNFGPMLLDFRSFETWLNGNTRRRKTTDFNAFSFPNRKPQNKTAVIAEIEESSIWSFYVDINVRIIIKYKAKNLNFSNTPTQKVEKKVQNSRTRIRFLYLFIFLLLFIILYIFLWYSGFNLLILLSFHWFLVVARNKKTFSFQQIYLLDFASFICQ